MTKTKTSCDSCGVRTKRIRRYKNKFLCYKCYIKEAQVFTNFPIYGEPLSIKLIFTFTLTEKQKKLMDKRIKYLFPINSNRKMSEYIRSLIMVDLKKFEEQK